MKPIRRAPSRFQPRFVGPDWSGPAELAPAEGEQLPSARGHAVAPERPYYPDYVKRDPDRFWERRERRRRFAHRVFVGLGIALVVATMVAGVAAWTLVVQQTIEARFPGSMSGDAARAQGAAGDSAHEAPLAP